MAAAAGARACAAQTERGARPAQIDGIVAENPGAFDGGCGAWVRARRGAGRAISIRTGGARVVIAVKDAAAASEVERLLSIGAHAMLQVCRRRRRSIVCVYVCVCATPSPPARVRPAREQALHELAAYAHGVGRGRG